MKEQTAENILEPVKHRECIATVRAVLQGKRWRKVHHKRPQSGTRSQQMGILTSRGFAAPPTSPKRASGSSPRQSFGSLRINSSGKPHLQTALTCAHTQASVVLPGGPYVRHGVERHAVSPHNWMESRCGTGGGDGEGWTLGGGRHCSPFQHPGWIGGANL